jgi:hypothetical protein
MSGSFTPSNNEDPQNEMRVHENNNETVTRIAENENGV